MQDIAHELHIYCNLSPGSICCMLAGERATHTGHALRDLEGLELIKGLLQD